MSLLVAANDGSRIWMLSDTAISGGIADLRTRTNYPKIVPSSDAYALIGFAGDKHHGERIAQEAGMQPAGAAGLDVLRRGHVDRQHSVEFLYAFVGSSGVHLKRIADGKVEELPAAHIGNTAAFAHFQQIRHDTQGDFIPLSLQTFVCGLKGSDSAPRELRVAILAMMRLFAERRDRDVGGWPLAYVLTPDGAALCQYGYSASDPIFDRIARGSPVPHGTAEYGGYGLSVREFGDLEGFVVYQLQEPGGTVYVRTAHGYDAHKFAGRPEEFTGAASQALGRPVQVWFGGRHFGHPQTISVLYDTQGNPCVTIADDGHSLLTHVINTANPFKSKPATLSLNQEAEMPFAGENDSPVKAKLNDDNSLVTLVVRQGNPTDSVEFNANQLDAVIEKLGSLRSLMNSEVPRRPKIESGVGYTVVLDPIWRTEKRALPPLDGLLLKLRHPGFGWQTFLLPHREAISLGSWLCEHADRPAPLSEAGRRP